MTAFLLSTLFSAIYISAPKFLQTFDYNLRDSFFKIRGELHHSGDIVIVDIDEKSLSKIGHWPWSRNIVAKLVDTLGGAEVGLIAFDVIFAEEDNTSPHIVLKKIAMESQNVPNFDEELAQSILNVPTILAYQFIVEKDEFASKDFPQVAATFVKRNTQDAMDDYITKAYGTILDIPLLQESAYSSGFVNIVSSISGMTRYIPMVISYNGSVYPSLSLEVVRAIAGEHVVYIDYSQIGVKQIRVGEFTIPTNTAGYAFINYRGAKKTFQYISAVDVLNGNFNKEDIEGKIVLIGASAVGLLDLRSTPFDTVVPGVEIHANMIDNILSGDFISVPELADGYNILHIFVVVFIALLSMAYVGPFFVALFLAGLLLVDFYFLYYMLFKKGIILDIVLPLTAIIVTSIIVILVNNLFISRSEKRNREKIEQIESILSSILMPILIISKKTKKILYSNKYASKQYGLTINPQNDISIDDIYKDELQEKHVVKILEEKGVVDNIEQEFITSANKEFTALFSAVPLEFGHEDAIITMVTDITKQKRVENEIRRLHNNVQSSIKFASLIQNAIVPDNSVLEKFCSDYFTIWKPRDIVGGDIYLTEEISDNEAIIMVIDGAGHGVPGAFLTMLVKAISSQIIVGIKNGELSAEPNMILEYFNKSIKSMLKQEKGSSSNTGFDGGILYYNKAQNYCLYAGAKTDLYIIQNNELKVIAGDRKNVGFIRTKFEQKYSSTRVEIIEGTRLYLLTDGITDQEGSDDTRFGEELFEQTIVSNSSKEFRLQKETIENLLESFQKDIEQSDDITVVGIKLDAGGKKGR